MLTRRSMMLASIAAGVLMNNRTAAAKAVQPATPVNFDVPRAPATATPTSTPIPRNSRSSPVASIRPNWPRRRK